MQNSKIKSKKQFQTFSNNKSKLMNASENMQCQFNKKATLVCIQRNCNNYVFLCNDQECKCMLKHSGCIKAAQKELIMHLQKNIQFNYLIVRKVHQKFDQITDKFIDNVSKLKQTFQKDFIGECGSQWLTKTQKKIYSKYIKYQPQLLKSKQFYKLLEDKVKNSKFVENRCKQQIEYVEKISERFQKQILLSLKQRQKQLFCRYFIGYFDETEYNFQKQILYKSKIINSHEQIQSLRGFLNSQIKNIKLVYQGSQQNFQLQKISYKNINQENLLILVQTQFDKKIGGFANICSLKQKEQKTVLDIQQKSFLFSLTNKQKITPQTKNCSVLLNQQKSPCFIGDNIIQFQICDKSNINNLSHIKFAGKNNLGYSHPKYFMNDKNTFQYFTGNTKNSSNFKIKQWEIWEVRLNQ